jgi:hypothetical protein
MMVSKSRQMDRGTPVPPFAEGAAEGCRAPNRQTPFDPEKNQMLAIEADG